MCVLIFLIERLTHEVNTAFHQSLFPVKLTDGKKFNSVRFGYTLETTENKTMKGRGEMICLKLKDRALDRWFLARPMTAMYSKGVTKYTRKSHMQNIKASECSSQK